MERVKQQCLNFLAYFLELRLEPIAPENSQDLALT